MFEKFLPWGRFEWLSLLEWIHPKFAYLCTVLNKHILRFPMARLDLLGKIPSLSIYFVGTNRNIAETVYHSLYIKMKIAMSRIFYGHKSCHSNVMRPLCTYQCKSRGGEWGQGAGIWRLRLSPCRAFDRAKRPRVGTFDFDRWKPGINSEAVPKSVPRGFLKVTLLEKGMKFSLF